MYPFIYRLYKPAHFADPSYVSVKPDVPKKSVKYSVRITLSQTNTIVCRGFFPLFAANPFGTRTHVLTNPSSNVKVNGQDGQIVADGPEIEMYSINSRPTLDSTMRRQSVETRTRPPDVGWLKWFLHYSPTL